MSLSRNVSLPTLFLCSVSVRVRPLSDSEAEKGSAWRIDGNTIQPVGKDAADGTYNLDNVFDSSWSTEAVYQQTTKDIVNKVVGGFNGTVFAYGQTSSGKTHTMRGTASNPGIVPLAVQDIFDQICSTQDREYLLRVSYMEVRTDAHPAALLCMLIRNLSACTPVSIGPAKVTGCLSGSAACRICCRAPCGLIASMQKPQDRGRAAQSWQLLVVPKWRFLPSAPKSYSASRLQPWVTVILWCPPAHAAVQQEGARAAGAEGARLQARDQALHVKPYMPGLPRAAVQRGGGRPAGAGGRAAADKHNQTLHTETLHAWPAPRSCTTRR